MCRAQGPKPRLLRLHLNLALLVHRFMLAMQKKANSGVAIESWPDSGVVPLKLSKR
jgi:hypothetical protein